LGEIVDAWASRETSVSLAFFKRLRFRVTGIFLTEALVTLAVASCSTGSSAMAGEVEGQLEHLLEAPRHLYKKKNKLCITRKKQGKRGAIKELE
jgi:hypothetical protein